MKHRVIQDISAVDEHASGPRLSSWWGTLAFIALEGMGFALAGATYLYVAWLNPQWPLDAPPPDLVWGTLFTVILVASYVPNEIVKKKANEHDNQATRLLLILMCLVGLLATGVRVLEFTALHTRWDANVYGSLVWVLLGLHTVHLVTDVMDTIILTVLFFTHHQKIKRFSDAEENAFYWSFVVIAWLPVYFLVYWMPRIGGG